MPFYTNSLNFPNLTVKATPVAADILLIADSAAANEPKQITVGTLPFAPIAGFTTFNVTAATQQLVKNSLYVVNYTGGVCVLTLPTAVNSAQGDTIIVMGGESASNPFQIAQNASQFIRSLNQTTTPGTTLTATTNFDLVILRCDAFTGGLSWAAQTHGNFSGA